FPAGGEPLERFAVGEAGVALVYASSVREARRGTSFAVPELTGQLRTHSLSVADVLVGKDRIWIANDFGEWGGHLLCLDPATGAWSQWYDQLLWPTGIADAPGGPIVNWGSCHLIATDFCIRSHGADGRPLAELARSNERFREGLARSADGRLFCVE